VCDSKMDCDGLCGWALHLAKCLKDAKMSAL